MQEENKSKKIAKKQMPILDPQKKKKKKKRERERKEYRTIGDQIYFLTVIFIGLNQSELVPRKLQSAAKWPGGCVHSSLRFREKNSTY
jgi:hypothetical protein